jgi:hypothetical protein
MIKITVDGELKNFYTANKIVIGSSRFSDVRLNWIHQKHLTLHIKEGGYFVEVHSEDGFEYKKYYLFKESRREDKMIPYGETFKIGYSCVPGSEDARHDRDYVIKIVKC